MQCPSELRKIPDEYLPKYDSFKHQEIERRLRHQDDFVALLLPVLLLMRAYSFVAGGPGLFTRLLAALIGCAIFAAR